MDSWAWIEFFKGTRIGKKIKNMLIEDNVILTSSINIAEVYKFALRTEGLMKAETYLKIIMDSSFIIFASTQIAVESAKINHKLKIGLGDSLIYSTALLNKAKLVTGDQHFKGLEKVEYLS